MKEGTVSLARFRALCITYVQKLNFSRLLKEAKFVIFYGLITTFAADVKYLDIYSSEYMLSVRQTDPRGRGIGEL